VFFSTGLVKKSSLTLRKRKRVVAQGAKGKSGTCGLLCIRVRK
jgi:hypothetical protein